MLTLPSEVPLPLPQRLRSLSLRHLSDARRAGGQGLPAHLDLLNLKDTLGWGPVLGPES